MKLATLLLLAASVSAHASTDGWDSFPVNCEAELLPTWAAEVPKGHAWTQESTQNLAGLVEMTNVTCPAYLAHRNDGDAIRAFTAKKAATVDVSPLVEREGKRLLSFLDQELRLQQATFAEAGIDFQASHCGLHMRATKQRMQARLTQIQQSASALAAKCFRLNDDLDGEAQARARAAYDKRVPASPAKAATAPAQTKQGGSDITGVKEDADKRR